ncbi:MAG: alpha/beta hydrolase [Opitutales bacterium]
MRLRPFYSLVFAAVLAGPLVAQPVWLDMDQQALDDAYNQSVWAGNLEQVIARFDSNSDRARAALGAPKRFTYGQEPDEGIDVYRTSADNAPIHIFIHGGAWFLGRAHGNAHAAEAFVDAGVHFVVPDFSSVKDLGGNLGGMVAQLRAAVAWVYKNAATEFGGDPNRIFLSGFSSGGHLASVLATTDWPAFEKGLPSQMFQGAVLCSGMYDLYPVSLSARREYVNFTDQIIEDYSALRQLHYLNCPIVLAYGGLESPEFKRQSEVFYEALTKAEVPVELIVAEQYNHFEVIETLGNPFGHLGKAALAQIFGK